MFPPFGSDGFTTRGHTMDEAEAERHRKRVVAFAVLAAVFAAAMNGVMAYQDTPHYWRGGSPSIVCGPFYSVDWTGSPLPTQDLIDLSTLTPGHFDNLRRAVPVGAGIAALVVAVGGVIAEMPVRRGTTAGWVSAASWFGVWLIACVLAQTAAKLLRPPDTGTGLPPPGMFELSVEAIERGIVLGIVAALAWAIPRLIFRRIDAADWWPPRGPCLRFGFAAAAGVIAAIAFGTSLYFTEPRDADKWVRGEWVRWGGAYPYTMMPSTRDHYHPPNHEAERTTAAVAWYESRLRTWNRRTVVPVVVAVTFAAMLVGGVVLQRPVRFHFAGWFTLWTLAGVGSHLGAVWLRGDLWGHYAPVGTPVMHHLEEMAYRGGLIGVTLGFTWMFVVAVFDRLASPTAPRRYA